MAEELLLGCCVEQAHKLRQENGETAAIYAAFMVADLLRLIEIQRKHLHPFAVCLFTDPPKTHSPPKALESPVTNMGIINDMLMSLFRSGAHILWMFF